MYSQRPPTRTQSRPLQRPPQSAGQKLVTILFGPPGNRSLGRIVGTVIGILILLGASAVAIRTTVDGMKYRNIAWKPYASPDNTFKVKFPGVPQETTETHNWNGDIWKFVTFEAKHGDHTYLVEYADLHMVVTKASAPKKLREFVASAFSEDESQPAMSVEETTLARNPALRFEGETMLDSTIAGKKVPAKARGIAVIRNNRLFFVWTATGPGNPHTKDLIEFIDSFEVPPPNEIRRVF